MSPPLLRIINACDLQDRRGCAVDAATMTQTQALLDQITTGGDDAALALARRFGDLPDGAPAIHTRADLRRALDALPRADRAVLDRTAERIRVFAQAQRASVRDLTVSIAGGEAGHTFVPVSAAGCYAPGGRFPLPSSVLMTAVTARVAGVAAVWVASPKPTAHTLAAAALADADGLLAIGGAQAIAALARGLLGVPRCDVIAGPGNKWVTAAKHLLSGDVGIDMLAGPSELVILADDSADPDIIAADLLAQAEHDDDAVPILVSTSADLVNRVDGALTAQLATLPTASTARAALSNGFAVLADSPAHAAAICDRLAPEHLELLVRNAPSLARTITNAGAIFVDARSAEVLGDYGAGPNHVLPTGGTARFRAGLSVLTFLRCRTWLRVDSPTAAAELIDDAVALARMEGLEAHARSAERRHAPRGDTRVQ